MPTAISAALPTLHRRSRQYWVSGAVLVLLLFVSHTQPAHAEKLRDSVKKQSVSVRLVGRASPLPVTTFGANYESFVAALETQNNKDDVSLVKLVYRFLGYDRGLPAVFMDYNYVHRFHAVRRPDCDEVASTVLYSRHVSAVGEMPDHDFTFEYAKGATHGEAIRAQLAGKDPAILTLDREFETQSVDPMFLEPECGLAWYDPHAAKLEIVLGVQSPFEATEAVAFLLGEAKADFKPKSIDAQFAYVGGGFGGRDHTPFPLYVALAAMFYCAGAATSATTATSAAGGEPAKREQLVVLGRSA